MLNAEHIALESRLVQQMVAIREREMQSMLDRYTAIGTQASLLAGFAITSLTALNSSALSGGRLRLRQRPRRGRSLGMLRRRSPQ